jgi:predicted dehydrogenase
VKAGKAIYCEKPTAVETSEALRLAKLCEDAGVKNGVRAGQALAARHSQIKHAA